MAITQLTEFAADELVSRANVNQRLTNANTNFAELIPVNLYYNVSGTASTITLSDTIENYNAIEIFHTEDDYGTKNADSVKFWNNKSASFDCVLTASYPTVSGTENQIKLFSVAIAITDTTLTFGYAKMATFRPYNTSSSYGAANVTDLAQYGTHKIYKVVGYKI